VVHSPCNLLQFEQWEPRETSRQNAIFDPKTISIILNDEKKKSEKGMQIAKPR